MRIGPRLLLNSLLIASFAVIATVALIGGMTFNYGKNILEEQVRHRLTLVRDLKAEAIREYFSGLYKQATIFSQDKTVIDAMKAFDDGFSKYASEVSTVGFDKYKDEVIKKYIIAFSNDYAKINGGKKFDITPYINTTDHNTFALQYNYIFNNPNGIDEENKLDSVDDHSTYSKVHAHFHPLLREIYTLFSLEDLFLVNNNGDIVYSVAKGIDFTTSLKNGPYAKTVIGQVYRQANVDDGTKPVIITDYDPYMPSNDNQSSFIATPIYDDMGKKVGVLIFQITYVAVNDIMTSDQEWEAIGLGKTGEVYLIDHNKELITNSRFFLQDPNGYLDTMAKLGMSQDDIVEMRARQMNIGIQQIDTLAANEVIEGKTGFAMYKDYRNVDVLGTFEPINVSGVTWGVIAEMDKSEAFAPVYELAIKMLVNLAGIMVLIIFFATIVGIGLAKQISVPIENLSAQIRILSDTQDLTQRINFESSDEIGDMAKALNHLIANFQQACQETISSSEKMQSTANKLMAWAEEIDHQEAAHKLEDNYDKVHEKTVAIKDAGDSLNELSARLQTLSRQFKVFEAESERSSGW